MACHEKPWFFLTLCFAALCCWLLIHNSGVCLRVLRWLLELQARSNRQGRKSSRRREAPVDFFFSLISFCLTGHNQVTCPIIAKGEGNHRGWLRLVDWLIPCAWRKGLLCPRPRDLCLTQLPGSTGRTEAGRWL